MFSKQLLTIALIAAIGNTLNLEASKKPTDDDIITITPTTTTMGGLGSDPCTLPPADQPDYC